MSFPAAKKRKLSVENGRDESRRSNSTSTQQAHSHGRSRNAGSTAELAVASGQFKSNVFKFQVDELLSQTRLDHDKLLSRIQSPLRRLKEIIENIPYVPPKVIWDAEKQFRKREGIVIPFPEPRPSRDAKYPVGYSPPLSVNVVGSFALKTGTKSSDLNTIDLAITIPSNLFQKKDHLNYRFFYKRAFYVACVAAGIQNANDEIFRVSFAYQDDNTLRPIILVEPSEGAEDAFRHSKICIRIITEVAADVFPTTKTLPMRNNLRQPTDDNNDNKGSEAPGLTDCTPVYNGSLRSEACVSLYLRVLRDASVKCSAFRDACILGRTWLRQRGFHSLLPCGGFGHFEWAILVALLLESGGPNGRPLLSPSYSSYQIFKATIQFLASKDLTDPLMLLVTDTPLSIPPSHSPVLYDGTRGLNVLYKMSPWSYGLLRHESQTTLKLLNDALHDQFQKVFITRVSEPLCRFDQVISMTLPTPPHQTLDTIRYMSTIYGVISQALGDRAKLIDLNCSSIKPWSIQSRAPDTRKSPWSITLGLKLDSEHSNRIIDHGPPAEDKESAAAFRTFWGEKSELRRFKDGRILESLVWSDLPHSESVVQQIITYIMNKNFGLGAEKIVSLGHDFLPQLRTGLNSRAAFQPIVDAFEAFEKSLKSVEGLPLDFHQLSPSSPLLRYASPFIPTSEGGTSRPADIVLQFESSSGWPDDLVAIQMTKLAFLLKIGELIEESELAISYRIGLESTASNIQNSAFLDIVYSTSASFRLRIHHDREQMLLEKRLKDGNLSSRGKSEAANALASYKRTFVQSVRHTQALRTLSTRFPLLSPTIRALKFWASSHLLLPHVREELLELLVCHVFLYPYPWDPPASMSTGLLRTLDLLSRWDWAHEPLILDFNDELSADDFSDIGDRFTAWRKLDPTMNVVSFFVASNIDPDGVTWTQFAKPPKVVAARISTLARAAMNLVKEKGTSLEMPNLLRSPLVDYDFALHLNPKYTKGEKQKSMFKNIRDASAQDNSPGYTSVLAFVEELKYLYGQHIVFFHGDERTDVVAGLWDPQTMKSRPLVLKQGYSTRPADLDRASAGAEDQVTLNKTAVLNEIASIGGDIVSKVQINRE